MKVKKTFFKDFPYIDEQSVDTLNFFAKFNDMNVNVVDTDERIDIDEEPLVSILMTTYNRQKYVEECIRTILSQTYKNIEFIIVDDRSTDDTEIVVQNILEKNSIPFKFIETAGKRGPGLNKRLGWQYVRGEYVIFLDDDDYYVSSQFIAKSVNSLIANPNLSVVAFNSYIQEMHSHKLILTKTISPVNTIIGSKTALESFMSTLDKPNSTFPAVFDVKKLKEARISDMKILNDTQIWLRGFFAGDVLLLSDYVGVYRVHDGSIGYNLDINLILDNLDEKMRLFKTKNFPITSIEWIAFQISITLNYYFSKSKKIAYRRVFSWVFKNFNFKVAVKLIFSFLKVRIKYDLRRLYKILTRNEQV